MENREQGIFRTFTFRNISPGASSTENLQFFPAEKPQRLPKKLQNSSIISESSAKSEYPKPAQKILTPDEILEKMIKEYQIHKSIPKPLISSLSLDSCKQIVESLLKEKLSYQEDLSPKEINSDKESDKESENVSIPSRQISPPLIKMQAFRAFENVSPIEKDDSDGHTNYKIVSLALTPKEELSPDIVQNNLLKYENYKKEVVKLTAELKEISSCNQILQLIVSLGKDNEISELNKKIKEKIQIYTTLAENMTEELLALKKLIEPNEGFLENTPLQRNELKILAKLVGYEKKCDLKPSELETINKLIDLKLEGSKKFEDFIDELLAGHDIAEMAFILVKYINFLEEEASVDLKTETLNCLITEFRNEIMLEGVIDENLLLSNE